MKAIRKKYNLVGSLETLVSSFHNNLQDHSLLEHQRLIKDKKKRNNIEQSNQ